MCYVVASLILRQSCTLAGFLSQSIVPSSTIAALPSDMFTQAVRYNYVHPFSCCASPK